MKRKFRKKPVVIEAEQYLNDGNPPAGVCFCESVGVHIHTLEGMHAVSEGDWIITGVKGEQYACKPDIFEATYDEVSPLTKTTAMEAGDANPQPA